MNISKKLFSGFFAVLILLGFIASFSVYQLTSITSTYNFLAGEQATKALNAKEIKYLSAEQAKSVRGYLVTGKDSTLQNFEEAQKQYNTVSKQLEAVLFTAGGKKVIQELNQIQAEYVQTAEQVIQYKQQNNVKAYTELLNEELTPLTNEISEKAQELEKMCLDLLNSENEKTKKQAAHVKTILLVVSILALIIGIAIALYISRLISKPVTEVAKAAEQIAEGNLAIEDIQVKNRDEIGTMADSFNQMKQNLRDLIRKVSDSSDQVAASSEELSAAAEQSAQSANQVAGAVQEISTAADGQIISMEENKRAMNESALGLQNIAESASVVSASTKEVLHEAEQGNQVIVQTIQQMEGIAQSVKGAANVIEELGDHSKQIGQIVQVISDIANQTNLLALNAAIEAARAGEQGKGFAVVADEVRKLAEQSQQSSEQIASLIKNIQESTSHAVTVMHKGTEEVQSGTVIVNQAGEAFIHILSSIKNVTDQVQEVSAATKEISASTEQLAVSVDQLTRTSADISTNTQGVAAASQEQLASMEEITASADSLSKLGQDLQHEISKFKI
ncbi:methyl-accepting chemotaxis protein [Domibacillus epiphyticus]|uniref:Methyl-accepting chemotaxis protein n=1 Tax=Domibacillus epiphyticus TaxID=1714355 RepID=A0A1V2A7U3_9BACI|nr:methyl-accepting chemotaxis protein [Domibacillus epiphyticus]OMP67017.1 hypothetical protein BTO28_08470 [Domibacillus epiphyticus]